MSIIENKAVQGKKLRMEKGFTLLELIVVIIILGVLSSIGIVQYTAVIEKGRKAEARASLGVLRKLELGRYLEYGLYGDLASLSAGLPAACNAQYYFSYACAAATGTCTATRCGAGGKPPDYTVAVGGLPLAYTIILDVAGTFSGTGN